MSKVAIIADTHLIHEYHPNYDKIKEFDRLINKIMEYDPVAIFILGDFFDKKSTHRGHPISIIDGSKYIIPIIKIVRSTGIPWYALLGNHEDQIVLQLKSEAIENFHFRMTDPEKVSKPETKDFEKPLIIDDVKFWFGNIDVNDSYRNKDLMIRKYCQQASKSTKFKNVLLLHMDLERRAEGVGIEKDLIELMAKNFKLVLNGHEHTYKTKVSGFSNVILVPPSMPTWIGLKEGLILKYESINGNIKRKDAQMKEPHGFMMLDLETLRLEFIPFLSTMPAVSILYDVTRKDLTLIEDEWRKIVEEVKKEILGEHNIQSIIIIPVFSGNLRNLIKFDITNVLEQISNETENIYIADIRDKSLESPTLLLETPDESDILNLEGVFSNTVEQIDTIINNLKQKDIEISREDISELIIKIKEKDRAFFYEKVSSKTINKYTAEIIDTLLPIFNKILNKSWKSTDISRIIDDSFGKGEKK